MIVDLEKEQGVTTRNNITGEIIFQGDDGDRQNEVSKESTTTPRLSTRPDSPNTGCNANRVLRAAT